MGVHTPYQRQKPAHVQARLRIVHVFVDTNVAGFAVKYTISSGKTQSALWQISQQNQHCAAISSEMWRNEGFVQFLPLEIRQEISYPLQQWPQQWG
jgi:hypothetical protein